jgi:pimeloyl-ACP methyl ester carboxylesterase
VKTASLPRIAFDDVGDGEPALLLMPGWCGPRTLFRAALAEHARGRRVLALDWRGHGASDASPTDFGYAQLLDDALRVLDAAGVERVIPVGVAHAGWAAIDLQRRLGPRRVPGVAFIDWMVLGAPPAFTEALAALQRPESWRAVRDRLFEMWQSGVDAPAVGDYVAQMGAADGEMWRRAGREIAARFAAEPIPLAALEREPAPCPTLHLYAQPADAGLLAAQQAYAAQHPWFSVHRLAASSHFPTLEAPRELAAHLERFAASLAGEATTT